VNYETRFEIKKENNGTFSIFTKMGGDIFQDGFDSQEDAKEFLKETFG
jgi:hypothetical protein